MAKVDIVMPLYNKKDTVLRAIESIISQTVSDWRLLVVNDGSNDGSLEIVQSIDDSRIEIITQKNHGPGVARNTGLHAAKSEFIAFLDADDRWLPLHLEKLLVNFNKYKINVVASLFYENHLKENMAAHWQKRGIVPGRGAVDENDSPELALNKILFFHVGNTMLRRQTALKYDGFYDKPHCIAGEDTVFFMRVFANEDYYVSGDVTVCHHRENSDLSKVIIPEISQVFYDPETVLDYCPSNKREIITLAFANMALNTARQKARHGFKSEAKELIELWPQMAQFKTKYYRLRYEILMSSIFPFWCKFKCMVGPPIRRWLNSKRYKIDEK